MFFVNTGNCFKITYWKLGHTHTQTHTLKQYKLELPEIKCTYYYKFFPPIFKN